MTGWKPTRQSPAESGAVKHEVAQELGEQALLLPALVNRALEANDRGKYFLTLFQAARAHADQPERPSSSLRDERLAAGISDDHLDDVVGGSHRNGRDSYSIPGAMELLHALTTAIREMLAPLTAVVPERIDVERLNALVEKAPPLSDDGFAGSYIEEMASADRTQGDSYHQLIMDAHRALNQLQTEIATESLDGASVYQLEKEDRPLVSAFMAGVRSTSALKFEHPGLGTTATRTGERLLIQNDIGETTAHLIVIGVEGLSVIVTYTDNHLGRLKFLQAILDRYNIAWSGAEKRQGSASIGSHHLVIGRYQASDIEALRHFLQFLGSRLVFLIDWNRARKRIGAFVSNKDAVALLQWAAEVDCGHMAFLQLGGERLIYNAVELAAKIPARYGEPLADVLGPGATLEVIRFALRASAEGMLSGKSQQLIRDELRVELLHHVSAAHTRLLEAAADHATLIVESALALRTALLHLGSIDGEGYLLRASQRAVTWEHRADEILTEVRVAARRVEGAGALVQLLTTADDAIDDLEEALFLLTLLPEEAIGVVRSVLDTLADVCVSAAKEHLKALLIAREVIDGAGAGPDDLEDFLVAVDRVMTLEHEADDCDRISRATFVARTEDFRSLFVADSVSRGIEDATDALMRSSLGLRDHILGQLAAS
ncbi:MAG: hypothetical protein ACLP6E_11415 [Acidimicrobiales bacterium]